ncbi:Holliday junction resolvase [Candidatus Poribacteria bacterium]|nr:Holliday junction resolvase [Candidatus Poribacteria bacterium]
MKQIFTIQGELPDFNSIIAASKQHWAQYYTFKQQYTNLVWLCARAALKPFQQFPVDFSIHWYCKDKRKDKDNISAGKKFILDGLIAARIIPSDSWRHVGNFEDKFYIDRANPRIVVSMTSQLPTETEETMETQPISET